MNLNELRDKAYKNACEHEFHDPELNLLGYCMQYEDEEWED